MPPPEPPAELNAEAAAEWRRIVAILVGQRILTEADRAALVIYASSVAQYRQALDEVAKLGAVVQNVKGDLIKNPWCAIQRDCWERIRPLLSEFGLTPCARGRLKLDDPDEDDEFDVPAKTAV